MIGPSIWHLFGDFVWHFVGHCICQSSNIFSDCHFSIFSGTHKKLIFFLANILTLYLTYILTRYLAFCLAFSLISLLVLYLMFSCLLWHSSKDRFWHFDVPAGIEPDLLSDSLSDASSAIHSDILSGVLCLIFCLAVSLACIRTIYLKHSLTLPILVLNAVWHLLWRFASQVFSDNHASFFDLLFTVFEIYADVSSFYNEVNSGIVLHVDTFCLLFHVANLLAFCLTSICLTWHQLLTCCLTFFLEPFSDIPSDMLTFDIQCDTFARIWSDVYLTSWFDHLFPKLDAEAAHGSWRGQGEAEEQADMKSGDPLLTGGEDMGRHSMLQPSLFICKKEMCYLFHLSQVKQTNHWPWSWFFVALFVYTDCILLTFWSCLCETCGV